MPYLYIGHQERLAELEFIREGKARVELERVLRVLTHFKLHPIKASAATKRMAKVARAKETRNARRSKVES